MGELNISEVDLYELLEIPFESTLNDVSNNSLILTLCLTSLPVDKKSL